MPVRKGDTFLGAALGRILYHIHDLHDYFDNVDAMEFAKNKMFQDCARSRLAAIGEEIKAVTGTNVGKDPYGILARYSEVDWNGLKGMRDIIDHNYKKVVEEFLWNAINEDLPLLENAIKQMAAENSVIKNASEVNLTEMREEWEIRTDDWISRLEEEQHLKFPGC